MVLKIRTTDKELNLTQEDRPQTVLIFQIELLYALLSHRCKVNCSYYHNCSLLVTERRKEEIWRCPNWLLTADEDMVGGINCQGRNILLEFLNFYAWL